MKIRAVTFQSGSGDASASAQTLFCEQYRKLLPDLPEVRAMADLLELLEKEFDVPDQWVSTSHTTIVFSDRDFETVAEMRSTRDSATLIVSPTGARDEALIYRLEGRSKIIFETTDAKKAAAYAAQILNESKR